MKNKRAVKKQETKTVIIDGKSQHLDDEDVLAIHPNKAHWLANFEKESFDKVVIMNSPTSALKSLAFFFMAKILKPSSILEVFVDQPISVMQALDASEIEANAKLAGFVDIQQHEIETFHKEGDKDIKVKSLKLSMVRPDKAPEQGDVEKKAKK
jgi:hypothetical protein